MYNNENVKAEIHKNNKIRRFVTEIKVSPQYSATLLDTL